MTRLRTQRPFPEELPRLLAERRLSLRQLARQVGVTDAHLSRVVRRADYKTISGGLAQRVSLALGLPDDYFIEARENYVIERVRADAGLRDRLFDRLKKDER